MGLLDMLLPTSESATKKTLLAQQKKIEELEEVVSMLTGELQEMQEKFQEIAQLVSFIANAQHQMSLDMNVIYESVNSVSSILEANAQESDDKYFTWRWNIKDDDDDLPN